MAKISKQDQWQQESAKLKVHGFKWRFTGIIDGKKQWQLYTPEDKPISKAEALSYIEQKEDFEKAVEWAEIQASFHEIYWEGDFSEAVRECDELMMPPIYQEGDSYVVFPATVQITQEGDHITRYTLPSGKVFIMKGDFLYQAGEPGLAID